ncbi:MAG: lipopolysaccharide heptosyltransferase family protein, partial [Pirellulales bacterium]
GTPCVGLFGPMPAKRNGPYGPQHIALQKARLEGSSGERRRANNATMLAISVDDVCDACDELLSRKHTRAA